MYADVDRNYSNLMGDSSRCAWAAPDSTEGPKQLGVQVGDVLAGKYRVDGILGVGGMGVVLEARHLKLDERVAIKLLCPEHEVTSKPCRVSRTRLEPPSGSEASTLPG
jgi:serine/threonine protein kinase